MAKFITKYFERSVNLWFTLKIEDFTRASFQMKLMKRAFGELHKFHMK